MQIIDILIPVVLGLVMFGVGTSLKVKDFQVIFNHPRSLTLGLSMQMLFLPLMAFLFCMILPLPAEWKVGIVILSLCPGGATSNFIAYLLDLKTALSISLTTINSFLILATIPIGVNLASNYFLGSETEVSISAKDTLRNVFFSILLPVLFGVLANWKFENFLDKVRISIKYTTGIMLGLVFAIKFFAGESSGGSGITSKEIIMLLPVMVVFHVATMLFSFWLAYRSPVEKYDAITIGIEVGLQNTALALLVSSVMLTDNEISKPTLVYAMFSFFTTLAFGYFAKRRIRIININRWRAIRRQRKEQKTQSKD
jgi:BASS family bile acid:Na+ symporter